ncbi:STAS domain-containing protein [Streptacidiphilus sp. ASG 303]|uniref:STAS domain-containing protein n=1 Tax=Streptacidiphilus sp. ASG 303 TaxID=2896847 RepID=UPI001E65796E|nr:STAS domain-containing protein [Streptacidiphilus sp. ASG 303]MCD0480887.1 STAS domain-containing protein [Streptacidiphilus sp. ASG 303]
MLNLTVVMEQDRDETVIAVQGEIDVDTRPTLSRTAASLPGGAAVRLDLSRVTFMDAAGLHFMLDLRRLVAGSDGRLVVAGVHDQPARLLDVAGVSGLFRFSPGADEARTAGLAC